MSFRFEARTQGYTGPDVLPISTHLPNAAVYVDTFPSRTEFNEPIDTEKWDLLYLPDDRPANFPATRPGYAAQTDDVLIGDKSVLLRSQKPNPSTAPQMLEIPEEHIRFVRPLEVVVFQEEKVGEKVTKKGYHGFIQYTPEEPRSKNSFAQTPKN